MVGVRKWLGLALLALSTHWVFKPGKSISFTESPAGKSYDALRLVELAHTNSGAIQPPQKRAPEPPKPAAVLLTNPRWSRNHPKGSMKEKCPLWFFLRKWPPRIQRKRSASTRFCSPILFPRTMMRMIHRFEFVPSLISV